MTTTTFDPDDPTGPTLPVIGETVSLYDGTTARVLGRYGDNEAPIIRNTWQVTGPDGARVVRLDQIAGYPEDDETAGATRTAVQSPAGDHDHVVARVLNAAIDWENASQNAVTMEALIQASDALHGAVRAYMPLVAG